MAMATRAIGLFASIGLLRVDLSPKRFQTFRQSPGHVAGRFHRPVPRLVQECRFLFELYQREAEKRKHQREPEKCKPPRPVNVRVKAPPGIGAVQTFSGRHINIGLDGIVEMSERNAFCLIPAGWTIIGDA